MTESLIKTCVAALFTLSVAACSSSSNNAGSPDPAPGDNENPITQQYEVTLTNLTGGQVFSEPAMILHPNTDTFWQIGQTASSELEALAESGETTGISNLADSMSYPFVNADTSIAPGAMQTLSITTTAAANDVLTILTRLESTNDGFTGVNAISLSDLSEPGQSMSIDRWALDSGTEKNLESTNLGSLSDDRPSEPNDVIGSEFNYVTVHPGVITEIEPIPDNTSQLNRSRKFDNPVIRIRITRVEG
ncbi:MAG: spondin domain-containing protein [Granulosicoccus sp.]